MSDIKNTTKKSHDYELIDSGEEEKLERFGDFILRRPDPQAIWEKKKEEKDWNKADAFFELISGKGKWENRKPFPKDWIVTIEGINFLLKPSLSKHIGIFPEQSFHWRWLSEKIKEKIVSGRKISVLNLFAYTGGASLACAKSGASVCHVDSSDFAVDCAAKNRDVSHLSDSNIRFIVEDVRKFVEREVRRGNKYDIIIMDPPIYGKGAKKEIWNLEKDLPNLLLKIKKLLSPKPVAVLLNGYASGYSHITYKQMLSQITTDFEGTLSSAELYIEESEGGRLLPCGIFAKFEGK